MLEIVMSWALRVRALRIVSGLILLLSYSFASGAVRADCPDSPPPPGQNGIVEGPVTPSGMNGRNSALATDGQGRFVVVWESQLVDYENDLFVLRFDSDGECICGEGDECPALITNPTGAPRGDHHLPSIAANRGDSQYSPDVYVSWFAGPGLTMAFNADWLRGVTFQFDEAPFDPPQASTPDGGGGPGEREPSVGLSDRDQFGEYKGNVNWARPFDDPQTPEVDLRGLLYFTDQGVAQVRPCSAICSLRAQSWQPCLSMRPEGHFCVSWAEPVEPAEPASSYNIALALYAPDGTFVAEIAGLDDKWVNRPDVESPDSDQLSPAVALQPNGDIAVVWVGPALYGCGEESDYHIYARRFHWDGDPQSAIVAISQPFIVDNDPDWKVQTPSLANPTVAFTHTSDRAPPQDRFLVAWNAFDVRSGQDNEGYNVRGQFFDFDGRAMGREFRVNQAVDSPGSGQLKRALANSAQHTAVGGPDRQFALTWTSTNTGDTTPTVHFTILPASYAASLDTVCCKADVNGDGLRNGNDVQAFVNVLLSTCTCLSIVDICPADMNNDAAVTIDDIPPFVQTLLEGHDCSTRGGSGLEDCNENGIPDANDIANCSPENQSCHDCNGNFIPDECDIASETSQDVDSDGIPDECEPDCQPNGFPDDMDIADEESNDVNSNGIPDECEPDCNSNGVPDAWDISQETSADCNTNGIPDECEPDCNANGVPDDCDIDPNDPDGNEEVSPDCNNNHRPDECDVALGPPWGSLDCNENGIPDECDIANCPENDPSCQDCNENGFLDACDIAAEISLDENENGIPDECEGENMMGGGGGMMQGEGMFGNDDLFFGDPEAYWAAWDEYFDWAVQQGWGPNSNVSGAEQFRAMADKLRDLGLPVRDSLRR